MKTQRLLAAIEINPDSDQLYRKLGSAHLEDGNPGEALGAFLMALVLAPEDRDNRANALKVLGMTSGYQLPGQIRTILADCALDPDLDVQAVASVIHSEFSNGSIADVLTEDLASSDRKKVRTDLSEGHYDTLFQDELLKTAMVNTILVTPAVERFLTALRAFFLEALVANNNVPDELALSHADFVSALACQCFNTEYIFAVSGDELKVIERLAGEVDRDTDIVTLSVLGCYRHLHDLPVWQGAPDKTGLSGSQGKMVRRLIEEPRREATIAEDISLLGEITDATSRAVQTQYETFPYPRWTSVEMGKTPLRFGRYVRKRFPLVRAKQVPVGPVNILVAGCGTGKQAIEVATSYKDAVVTAVDLSRASLAYARARSDERGLKNITFLQGDILGLGDLTQRFDLIECMGVLHHMSDPEEGLSVLKGLLKPKGFLRLALYSRRARSEVRAAATFVRQQGLDGSASSIREFRQKVYQLPQGDVVAKVIETRDFFSMSGLHDYVFNVHERTYLPLELSSLLEQASLEFLGFDLPGADVEKLYRHSNPTDRFLTDLEAWDRHEAEHPDIFGAMFQFWCRPKSTRA